MKNPKQKPNFIKNPLESLRDTATGSGDLVSRELIRPMADEFISQLFGRRKFTGELTPGEGVEMKSVLTGKQTEIDKAKHQVSLERQLLQEEKVLVEKKSNELRVQIEAIQVQVTKLATATPRIAREIEIASFQTSVGVSIYELFFLKHIYKLIKDFNENIEKANVWFFQANQRAHKKNVWGANYKKHGAKYLLSGEHYSSRSAA